MTWNPHKMMGAPLQCSAIFLREKVRTFDINTFNICFVLKV